MSLRKKRLLCYGTITVLIMLMIFLLSAQDGTESGSLSEWFLSTPVGRWLISFLPEITDEGPELDIRKYAHMTEYALLAVSSGLFFRTLLRENLVCLSGLSALVLCFLYACTDEFHQHFVPGRAGTFTDVLIDTAGALAGLLVLSVFCLTGKRKETE